MWFTQEENESEMKPPKWKKYEHRSFIFVKKKKTREKFIQKLSNFECQTIPDHSKILAHEWSEFWTEKIYIYLDMSLTEGNRMWTSRGSVLPLLLLLLLLPLYEKERLIEMESRRVREREIEREQLVLSTMLLFWCYLKTKNFEQKERKRKEKKNEEISLLFKWWCRRSGMNNDDETYFRAMILFPTTART